MPPKLLFFSPRTTWTILLDPFSFLSFESIQFFLYFPISSMRSKWPTPFLSFPLYTPTCDTSSEPKEEKKKHPLKKKGQTHNRTHHQHAEQIEPLFPASRGSERLVYTVKRTIDRDNKRRRANNTPLNQPCASSKRQKTKGEEEEEETGRQDETFVLFCFVLEEEWVIRLRSN